MRKKGWVQRTVVDVEVAHRECTVFVDAKAFTLACKGRDAPWQQQNNSTVELQKRKESEKPKSHNSHH
jgi:hypothetical protein